MSNEPVESGSAFIVKDEMLMRRIGMQDAPLFSTHRNNEELLKKCHNLYLCWFYDNSCERELKDRWFILGCSFRAFFNFFYEIICLEYQYPSNIFFNEELGAFLSDIHF